MGKRNSKPALEGDEKFMEKFSPGSTRYLRLWKKIHDFDGKLTESSCNNLVNKLKIEVASASDKEKPQKQLQLLEAMKWREQAEKRKRNIQKKQSRKQEKAALQAAILVKPDEETVGPSVGVRQMHRRQRRTQERQLRDEEQRQASPASSPTLGDAKVDPEGWVERHKQLVNSYGLNGWEIEQTLKKSLTYNFGRVKAGYTGRNCQGQILPTEDQALQAQLQLVHNAVKETWKRTPDYVKISQCRQKDNEDVFEFRARLEDTFKDHIQFLCDSGADRTVLRDRIPRVGPSKDKIMVHSANGQLNVSYFSKPLTVKDLNTGKQDNTQVVLCPECPVNILGQDLMTKLKISIVPTSRGMVATNIESVEDTLLAEGLEVHYYWSLDSPNPDPTETGKHLLHIAMEDSDQYHVTLRYKETPEPDVEYDKSINKLGPQKVTLSHLYMDRRGFAGCSAKLTPQAYKQFTVWDSVPHISLMKPEKADWKDVGQFVKRAVAITAWQQLPDGWSIDMERWSVYRKTLGWVVNATP
ncbi:hypothetical protein Q5P01_011998 [Channa striata]|uniref:Peptidase A2 domain-containing protein n=1 Tax=Channa striata TaxID=64152 RepID=A0AA88MSL2_CHASR|nr:hypothetical protein Q5P01_011998 [Channa striata]